MTDKQKYIAKIRQEALTKISEDWERADITGYIADKYGISNQAANYHVRETYANIEKYEASQESEEQEDAPIGVIEDGEAIRYDDTSDKYHMYLDAASKNIVLPGAMVRAMKKAYSTMAGQGMSINAIARSFKIPRRYFSEIKSKFRWTHDDLPHTDEEVRSKDKRAIVDDMLETKKFNIFQTYQQQNEKNIAKDADNWNKFQHKELFPFQDFLMTWTPPKYTPIKAAEPDGDLVFVTALSDLHFGGYASETNSYAGKKWSTEDASAAVEAYAAKVVADAENRVIGFKKCIILSLGDLMHTLTGFTDKGTPLKFDCLKEEQFTAAFNSIKQFIETMLKTFGAVEVHSVKGNHAGFGDWVIFESMANYFRVDKRIKFNNYATDHAAFRIEKTLCVLSHGASGEYKAKLPGGSKREAFVQTLLLQKPELLVDAKAKIFITADQHHQEMKEYSTFEHYMMGTSVAGDSYAETNGWHNRPSQQCLVIDDSGVKEVLKYYLD